MDTIATVKPNELQNVMLAPTAGWPQQTDPKLSIDDTSQKQKLSSQRPLKTSDGERISKCYSQFHKSNEACMEFHVQEESDEITVWILKETTGEGNKAILERRVFKLPMGVEKMTGMFFDVRI